MEHFANKYFFNFYFEQYAYSKSPILSWTFESLVPKNLVISHQSLQFQLVLQIVQNSNKKLNSTMKKLRSSRDLTIHLNIPYQKYVLVVFQYTI